MSEKKKETNLRSLSVLLVLDTRLQPRHNYVIALHDIALRDARLPKLMRSLISLLAFLR